MAVDEIGGANVLPTLRAGVGEGPPKALVVVFTGAAVAAPAVDAPPKEKPPVAGLLLPELKLNIGVADVVGAAELAAADGLPAENMGLDVEEVEPNIEGG